MKPRKANDLRELTDIELADSLREANETLAKQKFQHGTS